MPEGPVPADAIQDGKVWLPRLLTSLGLVGSNGEARRLVQQGGVRVNDRPVTEDALEFAPEQLVGAVVQVGRRKFFRIV